MLPERPGETRPGKELVGLLVVFRGGPRHDLLKVDGKLVAKGRAPGALQVEPGDSVQIGADLIKPVGDYGNDNSFRGSISGLFLKHAR